MKDAMKYKGYFGSVHFNDEELVFHGKIEFIRALVTYEATDAKGMRESFEEAVDDYLATCKKNKILGEIHWMPKRCEMENWFWPAAPFWSCPIWEPYRRLWVAERTAGGQYRHPPRRILRYK